MTNEAKKEEKTQKPKKCLLPKLILFKVESFIWSHHSYIVILKIRPAIAAINNNKWQKGFL